MFGVFRHPLSDMGYHPLPDKPKELDIEKKVTEFIKLNVFNKYQESSISFKDEKFKVLVKALELRSAYKVKLDKYIFINNELLNILDDDIIAHLNVNDFLLKAIIDNDVEALRQILKNKVPLNVFYPLDTLPLNKDQKAFLKRFPLLFVDEKIPLVVFCLMTFNPLLIELTKFGLDIEGLEEFYIEYLSILIQNKAAPLILKDACLFVNVALGVKILKVAAASYQIDNMKILLEETRLLKADNQPVIQWVNQPQEVLSNSLQVYESLLIGTADLNPSVEKTSGFFCCSEKEPIKSLLTMAFEHQNKELFTICLVAGADPNFYEEDKEPMIFAATREKWGFDYFVRLLDAGINIHITDCYNRNLFHYIITSSFHEDEKQKLIECLLQQGLDPNKEDLIGETPLKLAASRGDVQAFFSLEVFCGNPKNHNVDYLYYALCANDHTLFYLLLENGYTSTTPLKISANNSPK